MRVGLVCPYVWDMPGGVQEHVRNLAETLLGFGVELSVLTPAEDDEALPDYCVSAGRPVPIPYNGSVARLLLGPVSAGRTRRWLRAGEFDLLHIHEPVAPSVSLLACWFAEDPIVATFHTAQTRSRAMSAFEPFFIPGLEKVRARIAVSEAARRTTVEHLGGDALLIPNGVAVGHYADAPVLAGHPDGRTLLFVGRHDEPRKGLTVAIDAMRHLPDTVRLIVAGPGEYEPPAELVGRIEMLGMVSEETKASLLRSTDVFLAPNTGGESFGIVLMEAMAAGAPVAASNLDAFRRVLDNGRCGALFPVGDGRALAAAVTQLLADPKRRAALSAAGQAEARRYDWPIIARQVMDVYEAVVATTASTATTAPTSPRARSVGTSARTRPGHRGAERAAG